MTVLTFKEVSQEYLSTGKQLDLIGAMHVASRANRYVYPVTYDTELGDWVPRDIGQGDDVLPASRSRRTIELWTQLYPGDLFEVLPKALEDVWGVDPLETFDSPVTHQASLDETAYRRAKADQNAKRKLAAENYDGTRVLTWEQFMTQEPAPWLLEGLIGVGTVNFLVARSNLGKTFTFLDMALHMVTGKDWHGKATTPGKVLLVVGEGLPSLHLRVLAWCEHHGIDVDELAPWLSIVDGANLNNDVSLGILREHIESFQPALIVFDTWAATSGQADENDAALAQLTLNAARAVSPDAAILFTTHPTKSSQEGDHPVLRGGLPRVWLTSEL